MKDNRKLSGDSPSASEQIDVIISSAKEWHGKMLAHLRSVILDADPGIIEEVKWKKPSRPEGVAVWSHEGMICVADILKNAVRLTFVKGAQMKDKSGIFNTRLDSKGVRAIDFHQGDFPDKNALIALVKEGIALNASRLKK